MGSYEIKVCSQIANSLYTKACTEFNVTVAEPEEATNGTALEKPDWSVRLEDQRIRVGQSLSYKPTVLLSSPGYLIDMKVDIGQTARFAEFDKESSSYEVQGDRVTKSDIGEYMILVSVRIYNATYEEKFNGRYMLNIWEEQEIEAQWKPAEAIDAQEWEQVYSIRDSMQPEPYAPE